MELQKFKWKGKIRICRPLLIELILFSIIFILPNVYLWSYQSQGVGFVLLEYLLSILKSAKERAGISLTLTTAGINASYTYLAEGWGKWTYSSECKMWIFNIDTWTSLYLFLPCLNSMRFLNPAVFNWIYSDCTSYKLWINM